MAIVPRLQPGCVDEFPNAHAEGVWELDAPACARATGLRHAALTELHGVPARLAGPAVLYVRLGNPPFRLTPPWTVRCRPAPLQLHHFSVVCPRQCPSHITVHSISLSILWTYSELPDKTHPNAPWYVLEILFPLVLLALPRLPNGSDDDAHDGDVSPAHSLIETSV